MKSFKHFIVVLAGLLVFAGCQKEFSLETGMGGTATGSIRKDSATDNCLPVSINGTYRVDSTLRDSNYVFINVNVTKSGIYRISTNIENNFSFRDSGFFANTGLQTVKLTAIGKPLLATPTTFTVLFDSSYCSFTIPVIAGSGPGGGGGGGGGTTGAYTLAGSPSVCTTPTINGTYTSGTALTTTNTVVLNVNVTTVGTYSITTPTSNGMTFTGSGTFTTTGAQTITLRGSGTPVNAGTTPVPVTAGSSFCSFNITVTQGTGGGGGPTAADSAWSFNQGTRFFYGPIDGIYDTVDAGKTFVVIDGYTYATGDTALTIFLLMPGSTVQSGTFTTAGNTAAFYLYDVVDDIYAADNTTPNANTTITFTYNSTTKLVTGTFTGTAYNAAGAPVPITNGKFRGILQ